MITNREADHRRLFPDIFLEILKIKTENEDFFGFSGRHLKKQEKEIICKIAEKATGTSIYPTKAEGI